MAQREEQHQVEGRKGYLKPGIYEAWSGEERIPVHNVLNTGHAPLHPGIVKEGGGVRILATLKCILTPLRDRGGWRLC